MTKLLKFNRIDDNSQKHIVTLKIKHINESFFSVWTTEMVYVLGIIYTDGCLHPSKKRDPSGKSKFLKDAISVAQKDPELLNKMLVLMESNAKIHYRKRKELEGTVQGEIYYFHLYNTKIYDELINLGLTPCKSRILRFPKMPPKYIRHFIRGCWDGDGSVYYEKGSNSLKAYYVSGSIRFIKTMMRYLKKAGLPERAIYKTKGKPPSYYMRYSGYQCKKLFHYLYDNVPPTQYLERKYNLFKNFSDGWLL